MKYTVHQSKVSENTISDSLVCFLPTASLTQAVRNFAKGLEGWLVNSLDQIPKKMADVKVRIAIIANPCFALQGLICYQIIG